MTRDGMTMGLGMALMKQTVVDQAQDGLVHQELARHPRQAGVPGRCLQWGCG